jgi:hypothetical protein
VDRAPVNKASPGATRYGSRMARTRGGADDPVERRLDALHAEPPERFVSARDALGRELAAAGDPRAHWVKELRRPTLRVWALNRLARERPGDVEALLAAGERLRAAHAAALRGEGGAGLRDADEEVSRRLDDLVEAAGEVLAVAGHAPDHSASVRLRADLRRAAAAGGEEAERLRRGRLDREPGVEDGAGLGALGAAGTSPRPRASRGEGKRPDDASARRRAAAEERRRKAEEAQARRERAKAERERDRARRALEAAEREVEKNEAAAQAARRAREAAREALARAESALGPVPGFQDTPGSPGRG